MTRNPNEVHPFGRRRAPSVTRAAFVLLWLAIACFLAAFFPAASPADPAPSAPAERGPALQTPEDPEPGGGAGDDDGDEEGDEGEDGDVEPTPGKPAPDVPDSLKKFPAATLPSGAAPMETLGVTKPALGAVRPGVTTPAAPKERGTILGLHPALFFAALIVGHVFIVRAVTD